MQQYDYILVGQGISGTMLSWFLQKAGQRVLVYDDARPATASRIASGIINPVSGRKFELAWLYETIYPIAAQTYREMETALGITCFQERDIWNVWPSAQMRDAFTVAVKKSPVLEATPLMMQQEAPRHTDTLFQPFGAGIVKGANVRLNALLPAWRERLHLREERFNADEMVFTGEGVRYRDVNAKAVIFCEGVESPANPYFGKLKFLPNKGEALIIRAALHTDNIIKKGITLVPLDSDLYWAGATFSWDYADAAPTAEKRAVIEEDLRQLLKISYTTEAHLSAIRPSGPDRRPLVGMHPRFPQAGIFNGMGSKGCSLAPWAAQQFVRYLLEGATLPAEIDIKRYFNALR
ncbi:FAD-binding oxidoreductase [Chitinophaga sp. XS-30]|uniref:NAD(P)/FAD-dependent oxidoreductase n=1 Tax=Chitinophaga sp. XS-30 TaxID=2604421 RepID=UPI0011DCEE9C|nr:FAD-binding oxidoreductase [Chitinophaga sp. XS-30]QEH39489.1 FAD-binding oxidoreductase [Chitinophaga sp. XS-30]